MEMASANRQERGGIFSRGCCWFRALWESMVSKIVGAPRNLRSLGREDPRRIIHSVKVGFAIALVSLVYYFDPIYDGFGVSAMWAVITVVVVFEFSVGKFISSFHYHQLIKLSPLQQFDQFMFFLFFFSWRYQIIECKMWLKLLQEEQLEEG